MDYCDSVVVNLVETIRRQTVADLFGFPEQPKVTDQGFEEFWDAYPKCIRKGEKGACKKKWSENYYFYQIKTILKHLEWMKTTTQWLQDNGAFIPAPKVYLNQMRWDGAEVPEIVAKPNRDPALLKLEKDRQNAVSMPDDIRAKLAQLRGRQ